MMKKISTLLLLFILASLISIGQNTETKNQVDANGLKQGYWGKHYSNGNLQYSGNFKNNQPIGEFKRYDQEGVLKVEMIYKENSHKVYTKFYYPGKMIQAEGYYIQKLKDSVWNYYSSEGHKINEVPFINDQKHGTEKKLYKNGAISEKLEWQNDIKDGLTIRYYDNGKVMMRIFYMNGLLDGEYNVYGIDENILIQGQYENNKREGKWTYYKENGHIRDELNYINGIAENQDELERLENEQIEMLEKNKGKFKDPSESMYNEIPPGN
ncbi:toxin-antitoxin system YwqK family antitoxin [Bacteroidota bacterium]